MRFLTQERSTKEKLAKKFGVAGIPCLVILDAETAAVCTKNGERKRLVENGWFKPRIVLMLVLSLSWQTNRNYETQKTNRCVFFLSQVVKAFQRVTKRHFLSTVYIKMIIAPRQARDKHSESTQKKTRAAFSCRQRWTRNFPLGQRAASTRGGGGSSRGKETVLGRSENSFFEPFYTKMMGLPRQARDKQRENDGETRLFSRRRLEASSGGDNDGAASGDSNGDSIWCSGCVWWCDKRTSFAPFYTKNDQFTKTGSGQT